MEIILRVVVWTVFYGAEGWTVHEQNRDMQIWRWRKIPEISRREHRTNESILGLNN